MPDLVLLDLMLPRLGGLAVLESPRALRPTPVILLNAKDGLEDRVRGLEAGADDYVTKGSWAVFSGSAARRIVATSISSRARTVLSRRNGSSSYRRPRPPDSRSALTWPIHGGQVSVVVLMRRLLSLEPNGSRDHGQPAPGMGG